MLRAKRKAQYVLTVFHDQRGKISEPINYQKSTTTFKLIILFRAVFTQRFRQVYK